MFATLPTGIRGRLLAGLLLLVMLSAVYLVVVAPLIGAYAERQAMLARRAVLVSHMIAAAGELPDLRTRVTELTGSTAAQFGLDGGSDAVAGAALQSRLEELAASAGASIGTTESVPVESRGAYRRIGLRLAVRGDYETMIRLLAAIETTSPPLVVDNLRIYGFQTGVAANGSAGLDASLEVYGFRSVEPPAMSNHAG